MAKTATKVIKTMEDLLKEDPHKALEPGDLVEAKVISASKNEIWLDLGIGGAGLVGKREINPGSEIKAGNVVSASVIDPESDYGFPLLSLKKLSKEKGWDRLAEMFDKEEVLTVYPHDANRGGLLVEVEGIRGFLPVSQLAAEHYPRVAGADREEILQRLHQLVKQPIKVRVLDIDRDQSKLILSEKEATREDTKAKLAKIKTGAIVDGEVTGSVDFGIFVTVGGVEGLVHISEISWERISGPQGLYKPGDKIKAKVIAIDNDKLSLSIKQLSEDPWLKEASKFKSGDIVSGTITRITPFGAFVQLTPAVEALVHVSELGDEAADDASKKLSVGESHEFKVLEVDAGARKISLTTKSAKTSKKATTKPAKTTKSKAKVTKAKA